MEDPGSRPDVAYDRIVPVAMVEKRQRDPEVVQRCRDKEKEKRQAKKEEKKQHGRLRQLNEQTQQSGRKLRRRPRA